MTNRRSKAYATATVLGLGALGGFALGSNPGTPVVAGQASSANGTTTAVVTTASGATTLVGAEATQATTAGTRAPIVTRTSGASGGLQPTDD